MVRIVVAGGGDDDGDKASVHIVSLVGILEAALVVDVAVPIAVDSSCSDVLLLASSSMDADDDAHVDSHEEEDTHKSSCFQMVACLDFHRIAGEIPWK